VVDGDGVVARSAPDEDPPVKLNEPCATPSMLTLALPLYAVELDEDGVVAFRAEDVQRGLTGLHRIRSDADAGW